MTMIAPTETNIIGLVHAASTINAIDAAEFALDVQGAPSVELWALDYMGQPVCVEGGITDPDTIFHTILGMGVVEPIVHSSLSDPPTFEDWEREYPA